MANRSDDGRVGPDGKRTIKFLIVTNGYAREEGETSAYQCHYVRCYADTDLKVEESRKNLNVSLEPRVIRFRRHKFGQTEMNRDESG